MRIGRLPQVKQKTGLSKTSLWRRQQDAVDPFPAGIPLGPNTTGYDLDEVDAWLERRKARRTAPQPLTTDPDNAAEAPMGAEVTHRFAPARDDACRRPADAVAAREGTNLATPRKEIRADECLHGRRRRRNPRPSSASTSSSSQDCPQPALD
jgi:predicted DNA-binding transcriptional regulator AlpA